MKQEQQPKLISALSANFISQEEFQINSKQTNPIIKQQQDEQFQKIHRQYLMQKQLRKKQFQKKKKQQFGVSSSQQDDVGGSQSQSNQDRRQSTYQQQKKFKESQKIIEQKQQQKCIVYFSCKKLKQTWNPQNLIFHEQNINIGDKVINLKQIHKIKIIQGIVIQDCHKIKLSLLQDNQYFLAASSKIYNNLPLNYYIFSYIIQQKLINMDKKLYKCQAPNMPGIPQTMIKNSYNFGKIYKKSQILGKWQERLVVINKQGIFSYKKFNEKHSMFIPGNSVKQIWTRFQIEDNLLVIKILHSNSTKTQFGLPLTEVLDKKSWLFSFYLLAFP